MSSEDTSHEASQLGHGGSRGSITNASHRDQCDEGGAGFRDKQVVVDESPSKVHAS